MAMPLARTARASDPRQSQLASFLSPQSQRAPMVFAIDALGEFGGAREDRTPDLLNAIQALSHLSYDPVTNFRTVGRCGWALFIGRRGGVQEGICTFFAPAETA